MLRCDKIWNSAQMAVLRCHEFLRSAQFRVLSLANRAKKCSAKDAVIQQSWITKPNKGFWCKHLVEAPQKCSDLTAQILPKSKNVLSSWCSDLQKFRKVLRFKCSDIPQKSKKCSDLVLRWCSDRAEQKKTLWLRFKKLYDLVAKKRLYLHN